MKVITKLRKILVLSKLIHNALFFLNKLSIIQIKAMKNNLEVRRIPISN